MDLPRVLDRRFPRLLGGRGDDHLLLRPRGHPRYQKVHPHLSARLRLDAAKPPSVSAADAPVEPGKEHK